MRSVRCLLGLAVIAMSVAHALPRFAWAAGYWNVPGTFCQCMGFGCGAGYHAPLVLGPVSWEGWCAHNEIRLPHAPSPSCGPYFWGTYGASYSFESPSRLVPAGYTDTPAQATIIAPATGASAPGTIPTQPPTPAFPHSLFGPPVEP